jgi:hypothetical protein
MKISLSEALKDKRNTQNKMIVVKTARRKEDRDVC